MKRHLSSTFLPCPWLPPSFCTIQYAEISDIDFTMQALKRKLSLSTDISITLPDTSKKSSAVIPKPTEYKHFIPS